MFPKLFHKAEGWTVIFHKVSGGVSVKAFWYKQDHEIKGASFFEKFPL